MEGHGTVIMDIVEVVEVMEEQENGVITGMAVVGVLREGENPEAEAVMG